MRLKTEGTRKKTGQLNGLPGENRIHLSLLQALDIFRIPPRSLTSILYTEKAVDYTSFEALNTI